MKLTITVTTYNGIKIISNTSTSIIKRDLSYYGVMLIYFIISSLPENEKSDETAKEVSTNN